MNAVAEVWRHPVKSLQGQRLDGGLLGPGGLRGDRGWAVVDARSGAPLTARREHRLYAAAARWDADELVITLPDGAELRPGPERDHRLSAWLGYPVHLRAAPEHEPFVDTSPVHLLTRASVGEWDVRRFRPTLLLDGGGEDDWIGSRVEVGEAVLAVEEPTIRCVMTTLEQPGLPVDRSVLRTIVKARGGALGVLGRVVRPGRVSVGDALSVRSAGPAVRSDGPLRTTAAHTRPG